AIGQAQQFKLVAANPSGGRLLLQAEAAGLLPRTKVVPGFPVGADEDLPPEPVSQPAPPQFECAGGGKLVVVVVRVDKESFHQGAQRGRRTSSSTMAWLGRRRASRTHSATSSGRSIFARASAEGGEGRLSSSGVSMSPGKIAQARTPLPRSSALMACVSPARPNFVMA